MRIQWHSISMGSLMLPQSNSVAYDQADDFLTKASLVPSLWFQASRGPKRGSHLGDIYQRRRQRSALSMSFAGDISVSRSMLEGCGGCAVVRGRGGERGGAKTASRDSIAGSWLTAIERRQAEPFIRAYKVHLWLEIPPSRLTSSASGSLSKVSSPVSSSRGNNSNDESS
jgi:hypothetical protein